MALSVQVYTAQAFRAGVLFCGHL